MRKVINIVSVLAALALCSSCSLTGKPKDVNSNESVTSEDVVNDKSSVMSGEISMFVSTGNGEKLLLEQEHIIPGKTVDVNLASEKVIIKPGSYKQEIDGFGASFTDSSAYLVHQVLSADRCNDLMKKLFSPTEGIGLSFIRQPMGACDYSREIYSYCDMPLGEQDMELKHFSIEHDLEDIIPLLQQALKLNPELKIMASPWSPPGWMKTSGNMIGGTLLRSCYDAYARYFLRFIKEYEKHGVPIYAITVQNEPLYAANHYPTMKMSPEEQIAFINNHLGPLFESEKIKTKILCYDHNWDKPYYPEKVLYSSPYVVGTAWHNYGGKASAQSEIYSKFPDKEVYLTEASGGLWIGNGNFTIGFFNALDICFDALQNYSRAVVFWNIALDENNGPTVPGFGTSTCRGLVKIDQQTKEITYNLDYYALAHFSKVIRPGARRLETKNNEGAVRIVACENKDGTIGLVAFNKTTNNLKVRVEYGDSFMEFVIESKSVASFTIPMSKA